MLIFLHRSYPYFPEYDTIGTMKHRDGSLKSVEFRADPTEQLLILTIKSAFDEGPVCPRSLLVLFRVIYILFVAIAQYPSAQVQRFPVPESV